MNDARFGDAIRPLRLGAADDGDLKVISALLQDAVFSAGDIHWDKRRREFVLLVNRYLWDRQQPERVRAVLTVRDVLRAESLDLARDPALVLNLLAIEFEPGLDGQGRLELVLSGDGALRLEVEALNVTLADVTRPYAAPSGKRPDHP